MSNPSYAELIRRLHAYAGRGPKASRRRYTRLAEALLAYARARGAHDPSQLSRRLAYGWIAQANQRMRYYAARLVWVLLDRPPLPPPRAADTPPPAQGSSRRGRYRRSSPPSSNGSTT